MSSSNGVAIFKHPNQAGQIYLYAPQIYGFMDLPANKCLAAIGPGGAMVPIAESLEEALAIVEKARAGIVPATSPQPFKENKNNGTKKKR